MPSAWLDLELLRRWAVILDSMFKVPGTNIRFGVDAIVGLVPGLGDMVAPVFTIAVLGTALKKRVPAVVMARMVLNAGIDMLIGLVPILGDLADIAWKADLRNVALLERHARPGVAPSSSDYAFVIGVHRARRADRDRAAGVPHLAAVAVSLVRGQILYFNIAAMLKYKI